MRLWTMFAAALAAGVSALALVAGAQAEPLARSPDGRPLRLTFNEDFSRFSAAPSGARWRTVYGDGSDVSIGKRTLASNGELEVYVDRTLEGLDPFVARSGALEIVAKPTSAALRGKLGEHAFTSGLISSQPTFSQRYGYFEIRAKLPGGKGLWPALWMLPADQTWPPEIDIMESIGDPAKVYASTHSKAEATFTKALSLPDAGFHTYGLSWDAQHVTWFIDGRAVASKATPADMHKPMFLIANLAVGGQWPGSPDASTRFPAVFAIQYIRVYQFS